MIPAMFKVICGIFAAFVVGRYARVIFHQHWNLGGDLVVGACILGVIGALALLVLAVEDVW